MDKSWLRLFAFTFISSIIVILFFSYYTYQNFSLLTLINTTFMVGMFYTVVGTILFLVQAGSFNGITYSFKRFFRRTTRSGEMIREVTPEEEEESYLPKEREFVITYPVLATGLLLFLVSLVIGFNI